MPASFVISRLMGATVGDFLRSYVTVSDVDAEYESQNIWEGTFYALDSEGTGFTVWLSVSTDTIRLSVYRQEVRDTLSEWTYRDSDGDSLSPIMAVAMIHRYLATIHGLFSE